MSLGALIVGASKYSYTREHFADAPEHLKYSVVDAKAIEQYLETCWFKEQRNIQTFFDEEVTEKKLEEGFAALKEAGPFEHLFIFLSGHGVAHSETLGFLLQPHLGMPEKLCVLSALKLNALLSDCRAKQVILILDCCFAGAIASKLNYFLELEPNDNGRLFIASSRADQVTWEDERVGHGIFTAHLLDLLNTGDAEALEKTRDFLDVDSELFPILCEQVPLYTIKAKGAKQEPLKGGSSASPIYLPTVNAIRSLKSNTIYSAVTRKFRQFVFTASSVLLIAMISAYFFVYHIEPNERGNLVVKNGPRWLEPVFKYFPSVRTETRLNVSQLSLNPVQARDIQSGYASGVWLHKNERGYRGWVDDIVEGLEPLSTFEYLTLLGDRPMDDSTWANSDKVASKETLFRIWSLVGKDKAPLAQLLGRIPGAEHLQIIEKSFSPDNFDFSIIDLDAEQMFRFTKGVEYSSVVDHEQTWLPFLRFVTACQLWLYQTSEETKGRGTHNVLRTMVSDILLRQMNVRQDVGLPPLDMDMIGQLLILYQNGYSDVLNFAFARSGIDDLVTISRKTGLNLFQGNLQDTIQERAFLALIYTLDSTPISKEIVNKVSQKFEKAGAINTSFYVRLIIEGGANSSLPDEIITSLISQAKSSLGTKEKGFKDIELGRMLAFSLRQMNTEQQTITYEFIEALASNEQTLFSSMMAQIYGTLAEQNLDSPEMLVRVRAKVKATKMKYGSTTASSEKQPGITITSPNDDWILSLASFAASRELNADDRDLLISHIEHPELGITITRALAVHNLEASKYQSINDILFMLQREDNSAKSRREVEELSIIFLAKLNIDSFTIAIQELIDARENSIEPQTRASIGKIIIESTLERSRTLGTGLRLRV